MSKKNVAIFVSGSGSNLQAIIDSNIDEAREYLLHSLLHSESVEKFAFVKGVGKADQDNPKLKFQEDTASLSSTTKMKLLKLKMN